MGCNMETKVYERTDDQMESDEVAALLVKLYAEYKHYTCCDNDDYAKAVGIAIRMLSD